MKSILFYLFIPFILFFLLFPNKVFSASTPFYETPHSIPGLIEFEDFDKGGQGVAYNDADSQNQGGKYRTNEGVDITTTSDGAGGVYSVGWLSTGDWMKYTVNVKKTGVYKLIIRANLEDYQQNNPATFAILLNGVVLVPNLKNYYGAWGWQGYSTIPASGLNPILVNLTAGQHELRVDVTRGGGGGINYMLFQPVGESSVPVSYPTPGSSVKYVATNGNDNNPGTLAQPWRSLSKASQTAVAGDTVYIRGGTYNERLVPKNSGSEGNYIIYKAYPGEVPTIDGASITTMPQLEGLVSLKNVSFIQISGFTIKNATKYWYFGVAIDNSDHIIIDRNTISRIYSAGISTSVGSYDILIDSNTLTDTNYGADDTEVSLGTYWFSYNVEIKNNTVHSSQGEGIGAAAGPHDMKIHHNTVYNMGLGRPGIGIYIDAWTEHQYNIEVYNNIVRNNSSDGISVSSEGGGLLENVKIYNNLLYSAGTSLGAIGVTNWQNTSVTNADSHPLKDITIINNTLGTSGTSGRIFINNPQVTNIVIRNNIMNGSTCSYGTYATNGVCLENFRADLCSGSACNTYRAQIAAQLVSSNNLFGVNPQFVNPSQNNYQLQSTSPAIDKGISTNAPNFDYLGNTRPYGAGYDIGAYEYGSTAPYITPSVTPIISPIPTISVIPTVVPSIIPTPTINPTPSIDPKFDINKDGSVNLKDVIYFIGLIFL